MTTSIFYPDANPETNSVDGRVGRLEGLGDAFLAVRNGAGNQVQDTSTSLIVDILENSLTPDTWAYIQRAIVLFDTSSLGLSEEISAAQFSAYGHPIGGGDPYSTSEIDIVSSNPASNTALAASDYGSLGDAAFSSKTMASILANPEAYNDWDLDENGIDAIDREGVTKLGMRISWDTDGVAPTWIGGFTDCFYFFYAADQTGTSQDPKLTVEHEPTPTVSIPSPIIIIS